MRPQAPGLPFNGPPFRCRPAPRISTPVSMWLERGVRGNGTGRIETGREGTSSSPLPACTPPSLGLNTYCHTVPRDWTIRRTKIRCWMLSAICQSANSRSWSRLQSGRSPGLPDDHRAAPDPGHPPLEAVVPKQQLSRRSATSHGCRA